MIRVIVADDHPIVRKGMTLIAGAEGGIKIVGEATNGGELLNLLDREAADVLCLDINLPGRSGLELLPEIRQRFPRLPVLIVTQHTEQQMAVRAIKGGAAGYLNKDAAPNELVNAIKALSLGKKYVTEDVAALLVSSVQAPSSHPHEALSNRELRVFTMLAAGETVGGIAEHLNLSVKTVSTYRARVLEKLNLRNNADVARYALANGMALD